MPVVGSKYVVRGDAVSEHHNLEMYLLEGFPDDCGYVKSAFAILPDQPAEVIEEEELIEA